MRRSGLCDRACDIPKQILHDGCVLPGENRILRGESCRLSMYGTVTWSPGNDKGLADVDPVVEDVATDPAGWQTVTLFPSAKCINPRKPRGGNSVCMNVVDDWPPEYRIMFSRRHPQTGVRRASRGIDQHQTRGLNVAAGDHGSLDIDRFKRTAG